MTVQAEQYPHLLSWRGHVVPWVTRWSNEEPRSMLEVGRIPDGQGRDVVVIRYPDGRENRESNGILWQREGITRGGIPQFSQVSTYRQRAAMVRCRCQICGQHIEDQVIPWLFAPEQLETLSDGTLVTQNPPTCAACVPIAKALCPHLKGEGWTLLNVLEYRVWGVSGGTVREGPDGRLIRSDGQQLVSYDKEYPGLHKSAVVAKQQVVELTKYVVVESDGKPAFREGRSRG